LIILPFSTHQQAPEIAHNSKIFNTPEDTRNIKKSLLILPFSAHQKAPEIPRNRS